MAKFTKAQIKMFETIGVLVIFFFLLVAGVAFWFNVQQRGLQKQLARMDDLQSIQVVQRALFMPELDRSFVSVQKENCFWMVVPFAQPKLVYI